MEEQQLYFVPGQVVTLKLDIPNKPKMIVVKKETSLFKHSSQRTKPILMGIRCRWFTNDGTIQEAVFNTKDLELL